MLKGVLFGLSAPMGNFCGRPAKCANASSSLGSSEAFFCVCVYFLLLLVLVSAFFSVFCMYGYRKSKILGGRL